MLKIKLKIHRFDIYFRSILAIVIGKHKVIMNVGIKHNMVIYKTLHNMFYKSIFLQTCYSSIPLLKLQSDCQTVIIH